MSQATTKSSLQDEDDQDIMIFLDDNKATAQKQNMFEDIKKAQKHFKDRRKADEAKPIS